MRVIRLVLALALSACTGVVVMLGAPPRLSLLVVGVFMLSAPGLVLFEMLRVRDGLLGLVLSMTVGPALWVTLPTAQVLVGVWTPRAEVLSVSGLLALLAGTLLLAPLGGGGTEAEAPRHRLHAHQHGQRVVVRPGRHRGAFPSPRARIDSDPKRH